MQFFHIQLIGFITEMKSVYCAVRTWSLNKTVCASLVKVNFLISFECAQRKFPEL